MHRIHNSLIHVDKDRGLVHYGKQGQQVTCHLSCSYVQFLDAQTSVINMLSKIYWAEDLNDSLPVHLVWDSHDWFSDIRMSTSKRIKVERAILAAQRQELATSFDHVSV